MMPEPGALLAAQDEAADPGLWFVLYADDEGIIAFDLTREHPDIGYAGFEAVLNFSDDKPELEKIVLLGGPDRSDNALIILHETGSSGPDSRLINDIFSFMSYTYVPLPGRPPVLISQHNKPSEIVMKKPGSFVIAMGFRIFQSPALHKAVADGEWICLPANPDIIFGTNRHERRARLVNLMN